MAISYDHFANKSNEYQYLGVLILNIIIQKYGIKDDNCDLKILISNTKMGIGVILLK